MTLALRSLRGGGERLSTLWARRGDAWNSADPLVPALSPAMHVARGALALFAVLTFSLVVQLVIVSPFQQRAAQQAAYDEFRHKLANGTAPLAAGDEEVKTGTSVAYVEIPSIGVRQVVLEGTDAGTLFNGPGHRRDTPLPGQVGTSVILGRRAAFGAPFGRIDGLKRGALVRATTGSGVWDYRVIGVRRSGDRAPAEMRAGAGRLALVTAGGAPFVPSGVLLVDAELIVPGVGGAQPTLTAQTLPDEEKLLSVDAGQLWRLVLWLQALILVLVGAVVAWKRWHPAKAWVVLFPPTLLVGLFTAGEGARLLPNLL